MTLGSMDNLDQIIQDDDIKENTSQKNEDVNTS